MSYFPTGFNFSIIGGGTGMKYMRIHYKKADGTHVGYHDVLITGGSTDPSGLVSVNAENNGAWDAAHPYPWTESRGLGTAAPRNTWITYEMNIKYHSTSGQGHFRVWQDGILIFNDTTTKTLVRATDTTDFAYFLTYFNGPPTSEKTLYTDDHAFTDTTPAGRDAAGYPMIGPVDWSNP